MMRITQLLRRVTVSKYQEFPIEEYQVGQRLDRYLKETPIGWLQSQKLLRKKELLIKSTEGQMIKNNDYKLQAGDTLLMAPYLKKKYYMQKIDLPSNIDYQTAKKTLDDMIIYDNKNITIFNKTDGYSVQGGQQPQKNLFSLMSARYKKQHVHITHRIDKVTTGVVLFAKNRQTAQIVQKSMESKEMIQKYYLALTEGQKMMEQDYIRCNIQWTNKHKAKLCSQTLQKSKDCITFYKLLKETENTKFVGLKLLTGRKHQLRCHLADYLANPILNDMKYGGRNLLGKDKGIFLHAFCMNILNPQLIQRVFTSNSENEKGRVIVQENSVKIMANLPQIWKNIVNNQQLLQISKTIEDSERKLAQHKPRKKIVSKIV